MLFYYYSKMFKRLDTNVKIRNGMLRMNIMSMRRTLCCVGKQKIIRWKPWHKNQYLTFFTRNQRNRIWFSSIVFLEAATRGVLCKKVFLDMSENSQEKTCARGLVFNKVAGLRPRNCQEFKASRDWLLKFNQRHGLALRTCTSISQGQPKQLEEKFIWFLRVACQICKDQKISSGTRG